MQEHLPPLSLQKNPNSVLLHFIHPTASQQSLDQPLILLLLILLDRDLVLILRIQVVFLLSFGLIQKDVKLAAKHERGHQVLKSSPDFLLQFALLQLRRQVVSNLLLLFCGPHDAVVVFALYQSQNVGNDRLCVDHGRGKRQLVDHVETGLLTLDSGHDLFDLLSVHLVWLCQLIQLLHAFHLEFKLWVFEIDACVEFGIGLKDIEGSVRLLLFFLFGLDLLLDHTLASYKLFLDIWTHVRLRVRSVILRTFFHFPLRVHFKSKGLR